MIRVANTLVASKLVLHVVTLRALNRIQWKVAYILIVKHQQLFLWNWLSSNSSALKALTDGQTEGHTHRRQ